MTRAISSLEFATLLKNFKISNTDRVAVAVSGGADSLALALLSAEYFQHCNTYTIDHKLRSESSREAEYVQTILKDRGIHHEILPFTNPPTNNIQVEARVMRYSLLSKACQKNDIGYLLTAHHQGDQLETLFYRLAKASGITGLVGITPFSPIPIKHSRSQNLYVVRPLLNIPKSRLIATCQEKGVKWVEDPSNKDPKYIRNSIRMTIEEINNPELMENVMDMHSRIVQNSSLIQKEVEEVLEDNATYDWNNRLVHLTLPPTSLKNSWITKGHISSRVFSQIIKWVSNDEYPRPIFPFISRLQKDRGFLVNNISIGNCLVKLETSTNGKQKKNTKQNKTKLDSLLIVSRPESAIKEILPGETIRWGERFQVHFKVKGNKINNDETQQGKKFFVRALQSPDFHQLRQAGLKGNLEISDLHAANKIPSPARGATPVIVDSEGQIMAVPTVNICLEPDLYSFYCTLA